MNKSWLINNIFLTLSSAISPNLTLQYHYFSFTGVLISYENELNIIDADSGEVYHKFAFPRNLSYIVSLTPGSSHSSKSVSEKLEFFVSNLEEDPRQISKVFKLQISLPEKTHEKDRPNLGDIKSNIHLSIFAEQGKWQLKQA